MNLKIVLVIYIVLDLVCIAIGMGVPIFGILLGFPIKNFPYLRAKRQSLCRVS